MPEIPKGARKPSDRLAAEATQDTVDDPSMLGDVPIRVLPQQQWKKWALSAVMRGDLDRWAQGAVHPDDVKAFIDADVTLAQTEDFMREWGERTGEDLGESGTSRVS